MNILSAVLQAILGLAFLGAGLSKLAGAKMHVDNFNHWKLPQWFRIVTGLVEVVGAAALVVGYWEPSWASAGALWLAVTMLGGILVHVRVKDSLKLTFPSIVLFILPVGLFLIRLNDLADFPG
ncbi:DoxX family protein [Cohnella terricola]|uniref:DoxX family protein n=1 Tax=Cohnella terricola TaxID=1289167 RepID=A0A559JIK6_9BACL|nr:DoxX family protein [Cohnella terricola]TVX99697.1 DoxX family protein [Cohnella terricola]